MRMKRKRRQPRGKRIVIIAGPNGAGKTTFAQNFLPGEADCTDFINADLIARGLSPFAPEKAAIQAGKIMLGQITRKIARGMSFAFETTLSGQNYARHIPRWRKAGYHVKLIFLSLPSAEFAIARVRGRVAQGGHYVADDVVRRRFDAGSRNFKEVYRNLVSSWALYENSTRTPVLISTGDNP
jgi:predicted ABC-type ATPase